MNTSLKAHFLIDDVIWTLHEITRRRPASLFDDPYMAMLKTAYEQYGIKTQLNLFYRTNRENYTCDFSLSEMTDAYKNEFCSAADWLKFGVHADSEFPDYPHPNVSYDEMKQLFDTIRREVVRFAGEDSFTYGMCPHWNAMSKDGVRALYDCGVRVMDVSAGAAIDYDPGFLSDEHEARLLQNRTPDARMYNRGGPLTAINCSVCSYNHFSPEQLERTIFTHDCIPDEETGMLFKKFHLPLFTLNALSLAEIEDVCTAHVGKDYLGVCIHEQYFYSHYFNFQPDYAKKIFKMGEIFSRAGYEFVFPDSFFAKGRTD
ncbi:MAG: hypothetical protein IJZ08_02685 [Clostridia bacterium]|nr:hypothetical protein [Clostridia bacterium]